MATPKVKAGIALVRSGVVRFFSTGGHDSGSGKFPNARGEAVRVVGGRYDQLCADAMGDVLRSPFGAPAAEEVEA